VPVLGAVDEGSWRGYLIQVDGWICAKYKVFSVRSRFMPHLNLNRTSRTGSTRVLSKVHRKRRTRPSVRSSVLANFQKNQTELDRGNTTLKKHRFLASDASRTVLAAASDGDAKLLSSSCLWCLGMMTGVFSRIGMCFGMFIYSFSAKKNCI
jgi:hypothetical protein